MFYITGDIHGDPRDIVFFALRHQDENIEGIIILGDVGANYYGNHKDDKVKAQLQQLGIPIICIHGNHENRPQNIPTYQEKVWNGARCLYEPKYENLIFPIDGEVLKLGKKKCLVIGGAYSVDKWYRIRNCYAWWEDEQPSEETKKKVKKLFGRKFDYIFTHTCPEKFTPKEMFLPMIDQSTVDRSTEEWLDVVEEKIKYEKWFCGHWHTDKSVDKIQFLYNLFYKI